MPTVEVRFNSSRDPSAGRRVVRVSQAHWSGERPERQPVTAPSLDRIPAETLPAGLVPASSPLVTLRVSGPGSHPRVTVTGEVDCTSAPDLRTLLDRFLDGTPREVVVDLTGVTFLDSAGLSTLAAAHRRALAAGGRLRVLAATRAVIRPLQITGLWDLLGGERIDAVAS
jgi:anti-sigma B factor antagonist